MRFRNIVGLREEKHIFQKDLCKILSVAQNTYSQYETGKIAWTDEMLLRLAKFYGVSVDYLLDLTDERKPYPKKEKLL